MEWIGALAKVLEQQIGLRPEPPPSGTLQPRLAGAIYLQLLRACVCAALLALGGLAPAQQATLSASGRVGDFAASGALPDAPEPQVGNPQASLDSQAQQYAAPQASGAEIAAQASIHGLVVSHSGAVVEGAQISLALTTPNYTATRQTTSDSAGRFDFLDLPSGSFKITISVEGFAAQSVTGTLHAGENYEAKAFELVMSDVTSQVEVTASPAEIAQAELKVEETQRVFGVIPNFYVTYAPNAAPLTSKQKFSLAWKSTIDPATFLITGFVAGIQQASGGLSGYGQGAQGYAKRYGAGYADGAISTMIGAAILPSWWKQDPRYIYQGTGTKRSRVLHAIARSVICNGDNGHRQVNYSAILGGIAAGGISNLYYPATDRNSAGITFENALYGTAGSAVANLFQEFVVRKLTPKVPNYGAGNPKM